MLLLELCVWKPQMPPPSFLLAGSPRLLWGTSVLTAQLELGKLCHVCPAASVTCTHTRTHVLTAQLELGKLCHICLAASVTCTHTRTHMHTFAHEILGTSISVENRKSPQSAHSGWELTPDQSKAQNLAPFLVFPLRKAASTHGRTTTACERPNNAKQRFTGYERKRLSENAATGTPPPPSTNPKEATGPCPAKRTFQKERLTQIASGIKWDSCEAVRSDRRTRVLL